MVSKLQKPGKIRSVQTWLLSTNIRVNTCDILNSFVKKRSILHKVNCHFCKNSNDEMLSLAQKIFRYKSMKSVKIKVNR